MYAIYGENTNLPKNVMARNESFKDKAMQNQERTFGIG